MACGSLCIDMERINFSDPRGTWVVLRGVDSRGAREHSNTEQPVCQSVNCFYCNPYYEYKTVYTLAALVSTLSLALSALCVCRWLLLGCVFPAMDPGWMLCKVGTPEQPAGSNKDERIIGGKTNLKQQIKLNLISFDAVQ